jgi:hypothetical protein
MKARYYSGFIVACKQKLACRAIFIIGHGSLAGSCDYQVKL